MGEFRKILLIAIGCICLAYSAIVSRISNFNLGVALPGIAGACLLLCAALDERLRAFARTRPGKWLKAGVSVAALSFLLCLGAMFAASRSVPEGGADAVIVLGAGLRGERVSRTLQLRLEKAIAYAGANERAVIVVSGGKGPGESVSEAFAMRKYLAGRGIAERRVITEDQSTTTMENFIFSKAKLDGHFSGAPYRVVFVTNNFHVLRAGLYAKKAGFRADGLACSSPPYLLPAFCAREYLALMWALAFELWPSP